MIGIEDPIFHVHRAKSPKSPDTVKQKYLLVLIGIKLKPSSTASNALLSLDASNQGYDAVLRFVCTHSEFFHIHPKKVISDNDVNLMKNEDLFKHLEEVALFNHLLLNTLLPNVANSLQQSIQTCVTQQLNPTTTFVEQPSLEAKDSAVQEMINPVLHQARQQITKYRNLYKSVLREACMMLLDPPNAEGRSTIVTGQSIPRSLHPAALTPLVASQDMCSKILHVIRTTLKSEG